jgi:hypothetical protein
VPRGKAINPKTITVGRFRATDDDVNLGNNPVAEAGAWWNKWKARAVGVDVSGVDIWETLNEISELWGWQADFYIELARISGLRLALYCTSSGNPPRPEDDGGVAYQAVARCCAALNGRGHVLSLHEYGGVGTDILTLKGTEPYHALRYRTLAGHLLSSTVCDADDHPRQRKAAGFSTWACKCSRKISRGTTQKLMKTSTYWGDVLHTGQLAQRQLSGGPTWSGYIDHPTPAPTPPHSLPRSNVSKFVLLTPQDTTPAECESVASGGAPEAGARSLSLPTPPSRDRAT